MAKEHIALILALIYPFFLLLDLKTLRARKAGGEAPLISEIICLATPFASLFYREHFWLTIVYFLLPLNDYFFAASFAITRWQKIEYNQSVNAVALAGGYFLSTLIYYLAFDQGPLTTEALNETGSMPQQGWHWSYWLPFAGILCAAVLTVVINRESWIFPLGVCLLIAPFFAHYCLWAMSLATLAYFYVCSSVAKKQDNQAYFAAFLIYMMGQFATLIIYAIFF
jgi:hypothetical protein